MENKESKGVDPFAGFVSEGYANGELVQEKPATLAAKAAKVSDGGSSAVLGAEDKPDDGNRIQADIKAAKEPAKVDTADEESLEESDDSDESEADKEADKPTPKKSVNARIGELTRARRDAERRAAAAEEALVNINRGKPLAPVDEDSDEEVLTEEKKPTKKENKRPDPAKYEFGELDQKYLDDVVDYKVDQKLAAAEAQREQTRQQEAASAEQTRLKGRFDAMMAKGEESFEDWEPVQALIDNDALNLSQDLIELILETEPEVGAKITHHLATNPKEVRQIAGLPPRGQAAYFGRLEARFSASAEARQPNEKAPEVPPPVKQPRGTGGKFGFDPATQNFAEFEAGAKRILKQG